MTFDIDVLRLGPLQTNGYLLSSNGRAVMIDPGDDVDAIEAKLEERACSLEAVWLTHAHFDHVGALAPLLESHPVPFYMHPADKPWLEQAVERAKQFMIDIPQPPLDFEPLEDGQVLEFAGIPFTCLFTPGHAPGHIAFYQADYRAQNPDIRHQDSTGVVFAGDTLFRGSIGRTDLFLSDHAQLLESIHTKLLSLPDETTVYSGHMLKTTIGREKTHNPFLQDS